MDYVTIEIPVRLWQRVDSWVDNSMAVDVVEWEVETIVNGACVRDAGWRAVAMHPDASGAYGWPSSESLLTVTLRREHWQWTLSELDRWRPYMSEGTADADAVASLIDGAL